MANTIKDALEELPPRARRIRSIFWGHSPQLGTTSACAENTQHIQVFQRFDRNYLRVRGEYACTIGLDSRALELPPRARRILAVMQDLFMAGGTTSACAENTSQSLPKPSL